MINPNTIKGKTFTTEKSGYSQVEVDRYLAQIAADYTAMAKENSENDAKIAKLVEKVNSYREDEEALKQALLSAQKEANKIIAEAKAKANNMIESAKGEQMKLAEQSAAECEKIVREHKERCAQLIKENTEITEKKISAIRESYEDEKAAYDDLRAEVTYFKAKLTGLYNEQIKLLMQLPSLTAEELAEYEAQFEDEEEEEATAAKPVSLTQGAVKPAPAPFTTTPKPAAPAASTTAATAPKAPVTTAKPAAPAAASTAAATTARPAPAATAAAPKPASSIPGARVVTAAPNPNDKTEKIDKVLNTNSFEPVIPKQDPGNLKFGKNTNG